MTDTSTEAVDKAIADLELLTQETCKLLGLPQQESWKAELVKALIAERDALQAQLTEANMQSLSDAGQADDAYEAQLKAESDRAALQSLAGELNNQFDSAIHSLGVLEARLLTIRNDAIVDDANILSKTAKTAMSAIRALITKNTK
jgi:hypothetical protein